MAKNIIKKTILILLTITVGFLINNKEVKALMHCNWITYQTYIDSNGDPINSLDGNGYYSRYYHITNMNYATNSVESKLWLRNDVDALRMEFYSDDTLDYANEVGKCPVYVELYHKGGTYGDELKIVLKSDYEYFVKNMYEGIQKGESNGKYADLIGNYKRGLIFVSTDQDFGQGERENGAHYKEINKFYENNNSNKRVDDTLLGGVEKTNRGARYIFYQITKDRWFNRINPIVEDLNREECDWGYGTKCGSAERKSLSKSFSRYFNTVGDFLLEEKYSDFGKYFKFAKMYDDNYIFDTLATDTMSGTEVLDEMFGMIKNREEHETTEDTKKAYQNQSCYVFCDNCIQTNSNYSSNGCDSCKTTKKYKDCEAAQSSCAGIGSSTSKEDCLEANMGTELYNEYNQKYSDKLAELDQKLEDLDNEMTDTIKRTTSPSLKGIEFSKDGYKINCDDIPHLHTYYMVIIIIAPILVILLGSIDFAKAVIASDEKKMQEFKSKFPKRLGLLVVLIIVPLIIRLILGVTDLDMDLMKCVINGYN